MGRKVLVWGVQNWLYNPPKRWSKKSPSLYAPYCNIYFSKNNSVQKTINKSYNKLCTCSHRDDDCAGRVCDLLRAESDLHEYGEVLRHRVPPQVPLSVHCVAGNNKQHKVFHRLHLYQSWERDEISLSFGSEDKGVLALDKLVLDRQTQTDRLRQTWIIV